MGEVYATVDDLVAAWRPLSDAEWARAEKLLEYASNRVRVKVPGIDAALVAGTIDALTVEEIVVTAVKRAMVGGDREGVTQTSEGAGPFSRGESYANPMGNLYLTDQETRDLGGNPGGRARTMRLVGGY